MTSNLHNLPRNELCTPKVNRPASFVAAPMVLTLVTWASELLFPELVFEKGIYMDLSCIIQGKAGQSLIHLMFFFHVCSLNASFVQLLVKLAMSCM